MCGIAGVISHRSVMVEPVVRRMTRALVHRGPDDEGYSQFALADAPGGAVAGFGFRRLAILDLSPAGHQPMVDPDSGDAIIFNGEIYNFPELRRRLEGRGHRFRSSGDTQVLLHALSAWGEQALDELDGMFAFAFYHAATRRVLLARDPLGIKPLYVARTEEAIVFASEVRAVLASGVVSDDLDPAGIAGFLAYGAPQDPLTVHRAIRSLMPGTCEWIDAQGADGAPPRSRRYWRYPVPGAERASAAESASQAEAAAAARVRELLMDSVRRQGVADVPLGVFLSGGIDSAAIAALTAAGEGPVATFAVGYEGAGMSDETQAAAETAHFLGTRHFQTIVDQEWVLLQWYQWLKAADRPSIDGLNTYIVSGAVRDREITVALSGLGADEIFGGYPSFRRGPGLHRLMRLIGWLPRTVRRAAAKSLLAALPADRRAKAVDLLSSGSAAIELTALGRRTLDDDSLRHLGFAAGRLALSPSWLPAAAYDAFSATTDPFAAIAQAEASLYMGNTLLRDADTNSMAHSLELRVPFLGRALVEYASTLPGSVRAPPRSPPKHLLRQAIAGRLPEEVLTRAKRGFSLPFNDWMFGPLLDQCEAAIGQLASCPFFDTRAVHRTWQRFRTGHGRAHASRPLTLVALGSYLAQVTRRGAIDRSLPPPS